MFPFVLFVPDPFLATYVHLISHHEPEMLSEITGVGAAHRNQLRSTF